MDGQNYLMFGSSGPKVMSSYKLHKYYTIRIVKQRRDILTHVSLTSVKWFVVISKYWCYR